MGVFRKQTARAPLTTVLLVLLLALSIAASSIGFTAYVGAQKQSSVIEGEYTTIAVPVGKNYEKQNADGTYLIEDGNIIFDDGTKYVNPGSALKVAKDVKHCQIPLYLWKWREDSIFFFNDTATTEIYTRDFVGSVRCV